MSFRLLFFLTALFFTAHLVGAASDRSGASALTQGTLSMAGAEGDVQIDLSSSCSGAGAARVCRPTAFAFSPDTRRSGSQTVHLLVRNPSNTFASRPFLISRTTPPGIAGNLTESTLAEISPPLDRDYAAGTQVVTGAYVELNELKSISSITPRGDIFGVRIPIVSGIWGGVQTAFSAVTGSLGSVGSTLSKLITMNYPVFNQSGTLWAMMGWIIRLLQWVMGVYVAIWTIGLLRGVGR